jgi:translation initiation factor RLI1
MRKSQPAEDQSWLQMSKKPQDLKPEYSEYITHLIKLFNSVIEQDKLEEEIKKKIVVSQTLKSSQTSSKSNNP